MTNLTDRFHIVERQSVVRSKKMAHKAQPNVSLKFWPGFVVFCDLLLNRPKAKQIYSLYIIKKQNGVNVNGVAIYASVLQQIMKCNRNARVLQLIKYTGILNFFSENEKVSIPMKIFSMETGS